MQPRFLFNAFAENYAQAREIGDVLVSLFDGFQGDMAGLRVAGAQALNDGRDDWSSDLEAPFREVEVISFWHAADLTRERENREWRLNVRRCHGGEGRGESFIGVRER